MEKRGQLGVIEFKFFIYGFIIGIIAALALVFVGKKKIIPFEIPVVCGFFGLGKRGQLGMIEFQYFLAGLAVGLIAGFILVYLGTAGVIPFKIPVC